MKLLPLIALSILSPLLAAQQTGPPVGPPVEPVDEAALRAQQAFIAEMSEVAQLYLEGIAANQELFLQGKLDEAHERLLAIVAEAERTAAHELLLGNYLFAFDRELSRRCHRRAFELAPENPVVIAEWATQQHRAGEYARALELYDDHVARMEAMSAGATPLHVWGLRADCLLNLGRLEEAVASWNRSNAAENQPALTEALFRVYSEPHPYRRRADLLREIEGGALEKLEELVELDVSWSEGPWDLRVNELALEYDLRLADRLLADQPARRAELDLFVDVAWAMLPQILGPAYDGEVKPLGPTVLMRRMNELQLWGEDARLAHSSLVANHLFLFGVHTGCLSLAEILQRFGRALAERAIGEEGDAEACNILAALGEVGGDRVRLEQTLLLGWQRYGDWRCGCGALAARGPSLKVDDPELRGLLEQFPGEAEVQKFGLYAAREAPPAARLEALVRLIRAELRSLNEFAALPEYFVALEKGLAAR